MFRLMKVGAKSPDGLEAVDHGRRGREQMLDPVARGRRLRLDPLALADVAPRADHLGGLALGIADQALLVVDPAPAAVALEEPVFDGMASGGEQVGGFRLDRGEVVGMHPTTPEVGVLQIVPGLVAEQVAQNSR